MTDKKTANEAFELLTGWDEIAIKKTWGAEITDLRESPFTFMRALVFVDARRAGAKDPEAKEAALTLTVRELSDYFADDEDEPMPDEPTTEPGKGA